MWIQVFYHVTLCHWCWLQVDPRAGVQQQKATTHHPQWMMICTLLGPETVVSWKALTVGQIQPVSLQGHCTPPDIKHKTSTCTVTVCPHLGTVSWMQSKPQTSTV
jgi:hypothetical protein